MLSYAKILDPLHRNEKNSDDKIKSSDNKEGEEREWQVRVAAAGVADVAVVAVVAVVVVGAVVVDRSEGRAKLM